MNDTLLLCGMADAYIFLALDNVKYVLKIIPTIFR